MSPRVHLDTEPSEKWLPEVKFSFYFVCNLPIDRVGKTVSYRIKIEKSLDFIIERSK